LIADLYILILQLQSLSLHTALLPLTALSTKQLPLLLLLWLLLLPPDCHFLKIFLFAAVVMAISHCALPMLKLQPL